MWIRTVRDAPEIYCSVKPDVIINCAAFSNVDD